MAASVLSAEGENPAVRDLAVNPIYRPLHADPRFEKLAKRYTTITLE